MASLQAFPSSLLPRAWSRALIPYPFPFKRLPCRLGICLKDYLIAFPKSRQQSSKLGAGCFIFVVVERFSTTKVNRDCGLIAFVASGLINSDAFRRQVMLFNISSQDCMVLLATVPSGPFVILSEPICNCTFETHLLRTLVTPCRQVCTSTKVDLHTGLAMQMNSKVTEQVPKACQEFKILSKGVTRLTNTVAEVTYCVLPSQQIPRTVTGKNRKQANIHKKAIFFIPYSK